MNQYKPEAPIVETDLDTEEFGSGGRAGRPSPSVSATLYDENYIKQGNDGNLWRISVASNGVHRWAKIPEGEQSSYSEGEIYGQSKSYEPPVEKTSQKPTFTPQPSKTKPMSTQKQDSFAEMVNRILTKTMFHYHVGDTISSAIGQPFFYKGKIMWDDDRDTLIIRLEPNRQLQSPDRKYIDVRVKLDRGWDTIGVKVDYIEIRNRKPKTLTLWEGGGEPQGFMIEDMPALDRIISGHKADMKKNFESGFADAETTPKEKPMKTSEPVTVAEKESIAPMPEDVAKLMAEKPKDALAYNLNCRKIIDNYKSIYPHFPYVREDGKGIVEVPFELLNYLAGYTGMGGLKFEEAGKEILYEYYTPDSIIQRMWGLAYKHGYTENGSVLEPAVATGRFLKYANPVTRVVASEVNWYSFCIATLIYGRKFEIRKQYFEEFFIKNNNSIKGRVDDLEKFDLVIGNPPYGNFQGKYAGMGEKSYTKARNQVDYFILRGLDLLKPNGLLVYIIGVEVSAGGVPFLDQKMNPVKEMIAERGELVDAYRLPNGVFETSNVLTDIVVIKRI